MLRTLLSLILIVAFSFCGLSQSSSIFFRNNTWNDFTISVEQTGTIALGGSDWNQLQTDHHKWYPDTEIASVNRDGTTIPLGDTVLFQVNMEATADTATFKFRVIGVSGGSSLEYSAEAPGFVDSWQSNGTAHDFSAVISGNPVIIRYKPLNGDGSMDRNVLFAIHDDPINTIAAADFANPNVINYMCYNIQMLPFGFVGMEDADIRGGLLPAELSANLDAVGFAEAFDPLPRTDDLEPAMAAAGFPYKTSILNDYPPFNGGVIIFSRWPIESSDEMDFALCGAAAQDCFANKGIKYASINKLGKKYHLFATHMDAGSGVDDLEAKNSQMAEIRDFISAQNIPEHEAVLFGGDFNVSPIIANNLFLNFHDSIDPIVPQNIGYKCSTMDTITGKIIDHVWTDKLHLIPLSATNKVLTYRSMEEQLWDLSDFSDHRAALGRFVYPDLNAIGNDTILCGGDTMSLVMTTDVASTFQWYLNGSPIPGAQDSVYTINGAVIGDVGLYSCQVNYAAEHGDTLDQVNALLHPFGPDTIQASIYCDIANITINNLLCVNGIKEEEKAFQIWPNPTHDLLHLDFGNQANYRSLQMTNLLGEVVLMEKKSVSSIDLSGLNLGVYILTVELNSGHNVSKKVIKY